MTGHDWLLIAPWWNWPRPPQAGRGRGTAPVLQKYDSPKLVETFLSDPQHRLRFLDQVDRVVHYAGDVRGMGGVEQVRTNLRKVFLPTHFRHYLVVCSLHCDVPGLPRVDREQVCQAGFVIRKRSFDVAGPDVARGRPKVTAVNSARRTLASVDRHIAAARTAPNGRGVRLAALQTRRDATLTILDEAVRDLRDWAAAEALTRSLRGWFPADEDGAGNWSTVSEMPDDVSEQFYPLYPLVPPADGRPHDASGHTIYFGLVPTGSAEHEATGKRRPRFDDASTYEIRCFVRSHAPACPTTDRDATSDCTGRVFWSEPTEPFGLAAHFDLRGTANRPINVRMPDLRALKAQAGQFPTGVQFTTPADSAVAGNGPPNIEEICSFSIPLITIVAMFVFQLFLPIVVLLFQLWFLLLLKFCIPPEIDLDLGLEAAINLDPGAIEVDANFDVNVAGGLDKALGLFGPGDELAQDADPNYTAGFNNQPRRDRRSFLRKLYSMDALVQPVDDRVWAPRVEWHEVVPV